MKRLLATLVVWAGLFVWSGAVWGQDFGKGMTAYDRGDFATAFSQWMPLAEQGDADAQYNLGVMYDNGEGDRKSVV